MVFYSRVSFFSSGLRAVDGCGVMGRGVRAPVCRFGLALSQPGVAMPTNCSGSQPWVAGPSVATFL